VTLYAPILGLTDLREPNGARLPQIEFDSHAGFSAP
jgi:hypothetical protein